MDDEQILDKLHILVHSLRLIHKYVPNESDKRLSALIVDKFAPVCDECHGVQERNKLAGPAGGKSFLNKLSDLISGK